MGKIRFVSKERVPCKEWSLLYSRQSNTYGVFKSLIRRKLNGLRVNEIKFEKVKASLETEKAELKFHEETCEVCIKNVEIKESKKDTE